MENSTPLAKGQKVKVFTDPIRLKDFEGNATIDEIKFIQENTSYCSVTFEDGFKGERFINNNSN